MTASSSASSSASPSTLVMNGTEQPTVIMNGKSNLQTDPALANGNSVKNGKTTDDSKSTIATGPSIFKVPVDFLSRLLKGLFILLVHIIVVTYSYATLPFYNLKQKPYEAVEKSKRIRSKQLDPNDPSSPWVGLFPIKYPYILDEVETMDELCSKVGNYFSLKNRALGYREVIKEYVVKGSDGKSLRIDGRTVRKRQLSDYKWITYEEMLKRKNNMALGMHIAGIKRYDPVVILCETCPEYFMMELAIARAGFIQVNVFSTLGDSGIAYAINDTKAKYIFTSWELLPKVRSIIMANQLDMVKVIYIKRRSQEVTEESNLEEMELIKPINNVEFISLNEIEENGKLKGDSVEESCKALGKDEVSFISK